MALFAHAFVSFFPQWNEITFELEPEHMVDAAAAGVARKALAGSVNTSVLDFTAFGSTRLKAFKASPDAFAQVCGGTCVGFGVTVRRQRLHLLRPLPPTMPPGRAL
jgi:hypothetical protein